MTFQVGDLVRMTEAAEYSVTVAGSVGSVVEAGGVTLVVLFEWLPKDPVEEYGIYSWKFAVDRACVEKVSGEIDQDKMRSMGFITPHDIRRPLNESEIQGLLSRKLETAAKVAEVVTEMGLSTVVTQENFAGIRDGLRMGHAYFSPVTHHLEYCSGQDDKPVEDKFLHVSKCKTMVSYAASPEKHSADVWTTMKYGRYLTKFHQSMSNEQVKEAVDMFNAEHGIDVKVLFGESEDDFIRAINEGPSESCQAQSYHEDECGDDNWFKGHIHPAAVYATGDFQVAWMETGSRITARTLINKDTKAFSRVYGDEAKLKPALEALGYSQQVGALVGCRLLKIANQNGDGHIMAYVDAGVGSGGGSLKFKDAGDYWELTDSGGRDTYVGYEFGGTTDGCSEDDYIDCGRCGYSADEDELTWIESEDRSVCPDCLDRHYTTVRTRGEDWFYAPDGDTTFIDCLGFSVLTDDIGYFDVVKDEYRGTWIKSNDSVRTYDNDEWIHEDDAVSVGTNSDGTMFVHESAVKKYIADGQLYTNADGDKFHEDSDEIQDWLAREGEEGWDSEEFTKSVVEAVAEPEVLTNAAKGAVATWGYLTEIAPIPSATVNQFIDSAVLATNPTCVTHDMSESSYDKFPEHVRIALLAMQAGGIRFTHHGDQTAGWLMFRGARSSYKIDHSVKPENWVELLKAAQVAGVSFSRGEEVGHCEFDFEFEYYQLAL